VYDDTDDLEYDVVVNDEEQYSIWCVELPCPAGWHKVGVTGDKQTCLQHIDLTWTDMRPRSLREQMAAAGGDPS
jgi:MbtH protein